MTEPVSNNSVLSFETYQNTIQGITEISDLRIAGSVGRSILHGLYRGDALYEYSARKEPVLGTRLRSRDIDVIGQSTVHLTHIQESIADWGSFNNAEASLCCVNGLWLLRSQRFGFEEVIDDEVMKPISGVTAFGVEGNTVSIQTSLELYGLTGSIRTKDRDSIKFLQELLNNEEDRNMLPEDLYTPFRKLRKIAEEDLYLKLRSIYRNKTPKFIRKPISPLIQLAKSVRHNR